MPMLRNAASFALAALLLVTAGSAEAAAEEPRYRFSDAPLRGTEIPGKHFRPAFLDVESYGEYFEHSYVFEDGTAIFLQFMVTNLGIGDGRGVVYCSVTDPDGTTHSMKNGRAGGDWTWKATDDGRGIYVELANHKMTLAPPFFDLTLRNRGHRLRLRAESAAPAYRPGRIKLDSERAFDLTVDAPVLNVTGSFQPKGGEKRKLKGRGFALHYHTNFAGHTLASRWLKFGTAREGENLVLVDLDIPKKSGGGRLPLLLMIDEAGAVRHAVMNYDRRDLRFKADRKKGYDIPIKVSVRGTANDGTKVEGQITMQRLAERWDVLKGLGNKAIEMVVSRVTEPMQYRFVADYRFKLSDEGGQRRTLRGKGPAEVVMMRKE